MAKKMKPVTRWCLVFVSRLGTQFVSLQTFDTRRDALAEKQRREMTGWRPAKVRITEQKA